LSGKLTRILRLRELTEELSRLELEAAMLELRRLETAQETAARWIGEGRRAAFRSVLGQEQAQWFEEELSMEFVASEQARIELARVEREQALEAIQLRYRERRKERLQVETLIDARRAAEQALSERRDQSVLDDWFQSRRLRQRS
jgi:hypothetical protein